MPEHRAEVGEDPLQAGAGEEARVQVERGHAAARKAIGTLRGKGGKTAERAAAELEGLLADTELLDFYRASLLET